MVDHEEDASADLGEGRHMELSVRIVEGGQVQSRLHIWTMNEIIGFTGGFSSFFSDKNDRVFAMTPWRTVGVNPRLGGTGDHDRRPEPYIDELGEEFLQEQKKLKYF